MPKTYDEVDALREGPLTKLFNTKTLSTFALTILVVVAVLLSPLIFETNDSGYIKVLQKPVTGAMKVFSTPGMFVQGFGDVYTYKASDILYFSKHENEGRSSDESIEVRFNDGATAKVTGNIRVDLPADPEKILEIHKRFRSYDSLIKDTVRQNLAEATILTAALMTAEDSYTTKRAEFAQMVDDQLRNGIYMTESETRTIKDPKTGETVNKAFVVIQKDDKGNLERKSSVLAQYGIKVSQAIIKEIDYEKTVADQIAAKQAALMQVVSAKANAEKAIQDRLTAEEVGRKNVAVAKYEQEVDKERAVVQATRDLEVAKLNRQAAEQNKAKLIAEGEGEGAKRRAIMVADGALEKRLDAQVKINQAWADAYAKNPNPTPQIVMGGDGKTGSNSATQMMEFMMLQSAKSLQQSLPSRTAAKSDE